MPQRALQPYCFTEGHPGVPVMTGSSAHHFFCQALLGWCEAHGAEELEQGSKVLVPHCAARKVGMSSQFHSYVCKESPGLQALHHLVREGWGLASSKSLNSHYLRSPNIPGGAVPWRISPVVSTQSAAVPTHHCHLKQNGVHVLPPGPEIQTSRTFPLFPTSYASQKRWGKYSSTSAERKCNWLNV